MGISKDHNAVHVMSHKLLTLVDSGSDSINLLKSYLKSSDYKFLLLGNPQNYFVNQRIAFKFSSLFSYIHLNRSFSFALISELISEGN